MMVDSSVWFAFLISMVVIVWPFAGLLAISIVRFCSEAAGLVSIELVAGSIGCSALLSDVRSTVWSEVELVIGLMVGRFSWLDASVISATDRGSSLLRAAPRFVVSFGMRIDGKVVNLILSVASSRSLYRAFVGSPTIRCAIEKITKTIRFIFFSNFETQNLFATFCFRLFLRSIQTCSDLLRFAFWKTFNLSTWIDKLWTTRIQTKTSWRNPRKLPYCAKTEQIGGQWILLAPLIQGPREKCRKKFQKGAKFHAAHLRSAINWRFTREILVGSTCGLQEVCSRQLEGWKNSRERKAESKKLATFLWYATEMAR